MTPGCAMAPHAAGRMGILVGILALVVLSTPSSIAAAELVMLSRAGCPYCERFDREIGPVYGRTDEGKIAPLRRVDIHKAIPGDLKFVAMEPLTPVFVLVDHGREMGRIRGYPGEDNFWGLLAGLIGELKSAGGAAVD
jgi:hypothetical protein